MVTSKRPFRMAHMRIGSQSVFFLVAILGVLGVGMTGFVYPYFFCPASPAACAGCPVWVVEHGVLELQSGNGNGLLMLLYLAGFMLLIGAVLGRSFCGLACPVGALQDMFSFLKRKLSSWKSLGIAGGIALAALVSGSIWSHIAHERGMDLLTYMWAGYLAAAGAFALGLIGVAFVARKRGVVSSAAFFGAAALIIGIHILSGKAGMDGTLLGSFELMGTLGLMAGTVGVVGVVYAFVGRVPGPLSRGGNLERRARWIKYGILTGVPISTMVFGTLAFTDIDPIGGITATIPQLFIDPNGWSGNQFFWIKALFTVGVIGMVAVVDRAWCRYLCPIGAIYGPTNQFSLTDVKWDGGSCIHCDKCVRSCPMGINPKEDKKDPECVRCLRCVDSCPVGAQKLSAFNVRKRGDPSGQR